MLKGFSFENEHYMIASDWIVNSNGNSKITEDVDVLIPKRLSLENE